jgi:hypothetical protein
LGFFLSQKKSGVKGEQKRDSKFGVISSEFGAINTNVINELTSPSPLPTGRQANPPPLETVSQYEKGGFLEEGRGGRVQKI